MRERRTTERIGRASIAVAAILALLAACGSSQEPCGPNENCAGPPGSPTTQRLSGEQGADRELQLATAGNEVLVVGVTEDDELWSWAGDPADGLEQGTPLATGVTYFTPGGMALGSDGWLVMGTGGTEVVDGDDELLFEPHAYRSEDGLTWEALEVTGFSGPSEIHELIDGQEGLIAVGNRRSAEDPSGGGFSARAWRGDGAAWEEIELPAGDGDSVAADVVAVRERLIAVGSDGDGPALWWSTDGGEEWERIDDRLPAGLTQLVSIAAIGEVVVVSANVASPDSDESDARVQLLRSDDAGESWRPVTDPPPFEGSEGWIPLHDGDGRFLLTTSSFLESWQQPEVCYADIERCRMDSVESLYTSDDGDEWSLVDPSWLGDGEAGEVVAITSGGEVAAVTWDDGFILTTVPGGDPLPTATEPTLPEADVTFLDDGDDPEVGVRYAAPLFIHCGMDWLYLGGEPWQQRDGPDTETGAGDPVDPDWPVAQQTIFGFATLTEDDIVEYSIGPADQPEVIATYERPTEQPPGCD